jgi:hypothetical protein
MYGNAVGRQVAIKEKLNPVLEQAGVEVQNGRTLEAMSKWLDDGYEADEATLATLLRDGKLTAKQHADELKDLRKDAKEQKEFFKRAYGEITRSDYLGVLTDLGKMKADRLLSTAQSITAASTLGNIIFAQFADTAIMTFAGTRAGTGWKAMFTRMFDKGIIKDIAKDDFAMASMLGGGNITDMGSYARRLDFDSATADVPGGMLAGVQRTASSLATAEGWASLSHTWNRYLRSSFGIDFAKQIVTDFDDYANLPGKVKGFYARHGVDAEDVTELRDMLNTHGKTIRGIKLPDIEKWADMGRDDLIRKYKALIIGAGDEAMLDPGIGDRPFLRRSPIGRLVLMMQSFTYKAGNEFLAPLIQSLMINPKDAQSIGVVLIGLSAAMAGNIGRLYATGQGDKADKMIDNMKNGDDTEFWEQAKTAWIRSPMAAGVTGTATDLIGTVAGPTINDAFQGATGSSFKPVNDEWVRFQRGQGIVGAIGGPTLGLANTTFKTGIKALEGDGDAALDYLAKRTPIANTAPLHIFSLAMKKAFGDN